MSEVIDPWLTGRHSGPAAILTEFWAGVFVTEERERRRTRGGEICWGRAEARSRGGWTDDESPPPPLPPQMRSFKWLFCQTVHHIITNGMFEGFCLLSSWVEQLQNAGFGLFPLVSSWIWVLPWGLLAGQKHAWLPHVRWLNDQWRHDLVRLMSSSFHSGLTGISLTHTKPKGLYVSGSLTAPGHWSKSVRIESVVLTETLKGN